MCKFARCRESVLKKKEVCAARWGKKLWLEEWEYPPIGVYLATDPSGGHALFAWTIESVERRRAKVVLVEQEWDFEIVELAPDLKPLSATCGMKMSF